MKVLILGGTGQIGRPVAAHLRRRGAEVHVLCRSERSAAVAETMGCTPLHGDTTRPKEWASTLAASFDAVVHLAASFDADMARTDALLTTTLLDVFSAAAPTRRLIYTGGCWLYGSPAASIHEGLPYNPPPWWRWMARHAERVRTSRDVEGLVIHPANVVDREVGVPPIVLREAHASPHLRLPLSPKSTWPLVDDGALARLYALALDRGRARHAYLGASEPGVSLVDLARRVAVRMDQTAPPLQIPLAEWVDRYGPWASGYCLSQRVDSTKAADDLGWTPANKAAYGS